MRRVRVSKYAWQGELLEIDNQHYRVTAIEPDTEATYDLQRHLDLPTFLFYGGFWLTLEEVSQDEWDAEWKKKDAIWQERVTQANKWWRRLLS